MTGRADDRIASDHHAVEGGELDARGLLPDGATGIDAGLTLTKIARVRSGRLTLSVHGTAPSGEPVPPFDPPLGMTGARAAHPRATGALEIPEIDAAARGAAALLASTGRAVPAEFVLALVGTGTAFAMVRDGTAKHLGGTALGGGSFVGIARRIDPALDYATMIARAEGGDRRGVDVMVSDAYPGGIGRIGPELTAAHLGKLGAVSAGGDAGEAGIDDVLAGLLNLHGENIAQIAASRARIAQLTHVVLAGGFVHNNPALVRSLEAMISRFGVQVELVPWPGFAGAVGAAAIAAEAAQTAMEVTE